MKNKDIHIVGYYKAVPKQPQMTKIAGYMKNPDNWSWEESINITRGLKNRDLTEAQVILNMNQKQIVRNTWDRNKDFTTLLEYYQNSYPNYINPIIAALYKDELNEATGNVQPKEENQSG